MKTLNTANNSFYFNRKPVVVVTQKAVFLATEPVSTGAVILNI